MDSGEPTFTLDGSRFSDVESFYDEVSRELMGGIAPPYETLPRDAAALSDPRYWGRNLDAFDDILIGSMGRIPYPGVRYTIVWRNSELSRERLGRFFDEVLEIIQSHEQVTLRME